MNLCVIENKKNEKGRFIQKQSKKIAKQSKNKMKRRSKFFSFRKIDKKTTQQK